MSVVLVLLSLLLSASAAADYEQVETFGETGQQSLTYEARGLATNATGAGGVAPGTLYAVSSYPENSLENRPQVSTYGPKGEALGGFGSPQKPAAAVAVDQVTGNVYVLASYTNCSGPCMVRIYSPDGAQLIGEFGEPSEVFGETIGEGPDRLHATSPSGMTVDGSGDVYISDETYDFESRIMVFHPQSPGDFEHYVYAGRASDIASGFQARPLALDASGDLFAASEEGIAEYAATQPAAPACTFRSTVGQIKGMTVDPRSGEVFYFTFANRTKIHQLSSCDSQGKFTESGTFTLTPAASSISALAFNPDLAYDSTRSAGTLYAADFEGRGYIFASAAAALPEVVAESVSSITASGATLSALVNPKGTSTRYAFQYISSAAYEANEPADRFGGASLAPAGGGALSASQSAVSVGASVAGLAADTQYHYRVIATSTCEPSHPEHVCEAVGADRTFRTFPLGESLLPDSRAWELVSPALKSGGQVFPAQAELGSCRPQACKPSYGDRDFPMQSSPNGESIVYEGSPFSTTQSAVNRDEYYAVHTSTGWQTTTLSPDQHTGEYSGFDLDLTTGIVSQPGEGPALDAAAPAGYGNLYLQSIAGPSALTPLLSFSPPNRSLAEGIELTFAGASADFSRLFFEANDALTDPTPYAPAAPDPGAGSQAGKPKDLYESIGGRLALVNVLPGNSAAAPGATFGGGEGTSGIHPQNFSHAISADGSRAFWSDGMGQVYVRVNGEETVEVRDHAGKYLTASADGSRVLLSDGCLYRLETAECEDLTAGAGGFLGIAGQSEDLSHIYFVDTAALTGGEENEYGSRAQAGEFNLYGWHEGATRFVGTLTTGDEADWNQYPSGRTAESSPGGEWLAFSSTARLTGYDNTGPCGIFDEGQSKFLTAPCQEVMLFKFASGRLICPSCNPGGSLPLGASTLRRLRNSGGAVLQPRYLADNGRLYFDTQDSLSPFDTNNGAEDVYQYEPGGIGGCQRPGGCVDLISAGREPIDSNFLTADATGKNVFFTTRDRLVVKDQDELVDLYDAREGGGIAADSEAGPQECRGEACQSSPPSFAEAAPASSGVPGAGTAKKSARRTCKKGRVRRKGRCVKKHHGVRHHARRVKHQHGGSN